MAPILTATALTSVLTSPTDTLMAQQAPAPPTVGVLDTTVVQRAF